MRKFIAFGLALVLAASMVGCGNEASNDMPEQERETDSITNTEEEEIKEIPPEIQVDFDTPILVQSNEKQVEPYVIMLASQEWTEYGWLMADAPSMYDILSKNSSEFPEIVYGDDFTIFYKDRCFSFVSLSVYSDTFEVIHENADLSVLEDLPTATYYLGIAVKEQGRYIETEEEYETTAYGCLYRLEK